MLPRIVATTFWNQTVGLHVGIRCKGVNQPTTLNLPSLGGNPPRFNEILDAVVRVHPARIAATTSIYFRPLAVPLSADEGVLLRASRANWSLPRTLRRTGELVSPRDPPSV